MLTTALISNVGEINFFCYPFFDSPAIFCRLLDSQKGGFWSIKPTDSVLKTRQSYWPDTNVLQTRYHSNAGIASLVDYMPIVKGKGLKWVIRHLKVIRGEIEFEMKLKPTFNFCRDSHKFVKGGNDVIRIESGSISLELLSHKVDIVDHNGEYLVAKFKLSEGDKKTFILKDSKEDLDECQLFACSGTKTVDNFCQIEDKLFKETIFFWQKWLEKCTYKGRWREMVERSALVLKLLTFEPTGAIVASPTCSLPEDLGGERNWDYRYTWIRDAAFTVYGLMRIGFTQEAQNFMKWLEQRCADAVYNEPNRMPLRIMYSIHGDSNIPEMELKHLEGYKGSSPVRVGNDAVNQIQMDIFGELMDSIYLSNKYGSLVSYDFWLHIRSLVDWVADNYHIKDEGIWEVRSGRQHFTYSKIMCWVALDRGLRLADRRSFPAPRDKWIKARDTIYEEIQKMGYSTELNSFVQYYGSDHLDASTLIMSLVFFMAPSDPRHMSTLKRILLKPEQGGLVSNSLVFRYNTSKSTDGLSGDEGTFNICTFWLIEALTRAGKYNPEFLVKARLIFDEMLGYSNHLGLFSEELGSHGEALGNFPQAFTHLSLISAAFNLDRVLSGKRETNA
eukprot:gene5668-7054_t